MPASLASRCRANQVLTDTTPFVNNLSAADTDVQRALETVDAMAVGAAAGVIKNIRVPIAGAFGNYDSLTSVPVNATIMRVFANITTPFDGAATITTILNGAAPVTLQTSAQNKPSVVNTYISIPYTEVLLANVGLVRVTIGGLPTAGAGTVLIEYYTSFLP